jgi:hypothetical protein
VTESRVRFANRRGEELVGVLHGAPQTCVAVSCHGLFSSKDGDKHRALAESLTTLGVSCFRFDFAGCGNSGGRIEETTLSRRVDDLDDVLAHLDPLGTKQFVVFGSSMGGTVALLTAARDERIIALATLAAVAHPGELIERGRARSLVRGRPLAPDGSFETDTGVVRPALLADAREHNVLGSVAVILAPLLVVHGEADEVVPVSDAHDIASHARRAQLEVVLGADHAFTRAEHRRPTMRLIAAFLARHARTVAA